MDLEKAFALSCNSYFIELCQKIGYKSMIGMAKKFGLGSKTGISEQGIPEASGNLPDMDAYYSSADIANLAIGQGVMLATPLQVADLTATIANGGIKNRVNIVDSITDSNGNIVKQIRKSEGERIISKDTSDKIRSLMEAVTLNGTGTRLSWAIMAVREARPAALRQARRRSSTHGLQAIFPLPGRAIQ
jgi:peptidoglycan glycosyltransferase/penicillin-binding protein 2